MTVIDRLARKQYEVEPREFEGRLLHQLPPSRSTFGEAYAELYLTTPDEDCRVALTKSGTRVIADLAVLPGLEHVPWTSRYLQGLIDVAYLNLTPGTRSGIVHDEPYSAFEDSLGDLEAHLNSVIEEQRRAEEEQANTESRRAIQRAFREAMLVLPREEYDWFEIRAASAPGSGPVQPPSEKAESIVEGEEPTIGVPDPVGTSAQRKFFEYPGPLYSVAISPAAATLAVNQTRRFRALPRDRARHRVEDELHLLIGET